MRRKHYRTNFRIAASQTRLRNLPEKAHSEFKSFSLNPYAEAGNDMESQFSESLEPLCKACKSMFSTLEGLRALVSEQGYEWLSFSEIEEHAEREICSLCTLLKEEAGETSFSYDDYKEKIRLTVERVKQISIGNKSVRNDYPLGILSAHYLQRLEKWEFGSNWVRILMISKVPDDVSASWLSCIPRSYDIAGDAAMKACLTMLKYCQEEHDFTEENHDKCKAQKTPTLPTRVIDLKNPSCPKIYISKPGQQACYVALSYCWGGPQEVRLTKNTFEDKVEGFEVKNLPRTIRDAIEVTGKLGFRYLWIDALCIIQDDWEDQNLEIAAMGSIYRNATLTIAASDSKSVRDGFLKSRFQYGACKLPIYLPDDMIGSIELSHYKLDADQGKWHLNIRGWALQEELLSPRLLFFANGEIRWQCQSLYKKRILGTGSIEFVEEAGLQRLPPEVFANADDVTLTKVAPLGSDQLVAEERHGKKPQQQRVWESIITNYSRRSITVPSDRLPALTGVINELEKYWSDKCVAGMWTNCLHELLFWRASGGSRRRCTASTYTACECNSAPRVRPETLAPTWSWLACEGSIDFLNHINEIRTPRCEIVSCSVEPLDQNAPLGPIKGGQLVIRASVIGGPMHRAREIDPISRVSIDDCDFTCHEIYEHAIYVQIQQRRCDQQRYPNNTPDYYLSQPRGLVLMEAQNGAYERVGTFTGIRATEVFENLSISKWRTLTII